MKRRLQAKQNGFSLVEVVLAVGVASFCLITLVALLPVGLHIHQSSNEQTRMANFASMISQDLQNTSSSQTTSPRFGFTVPAAGGSSGSLQTLYLFDDGSNSSDAITLHVGDAPAPTSIYRVSVSFYPPSSGQLTATEASITVTWPAQADSVPTEPATHYTKIFQTVVVLNRN